MRASTSIVYMCSLKHIYCPANGIPYHTPIYVTLRETFYKYLDCRARIRATGHLNSGMSCNQRVALADPLLLEDVLQLSAEWLLDARQPYVRVQLALQHRRQPHRLQEPFLPNLVLHRNDSQRFQVEKGAAFRTCADDLRMWTYLWPISYFRGSPRPGDALAAFPCFPIGYVTD